MDRAVGLFRDILDFKLEWRVPKAGGNELSALLGIPEMAAELAYLINESNGVGIEISNLMNPPMDDSPCKFGNIGTCCFSLSVNNLDGLYTRFTKEGWTPISPCQELKPPGGIAARAFCVRLEPGVLLELIEEGGNS
jgi:hypothetical protein